MRIPTRRAYVVIHRGRIRAKAVAPEYGRNRYLEWGSITKTVTAALVARLVADGGLSYETQAGRVLGISLPPSVTIEALVRHTSGLPRMHPGVALRSADPYSETDSKFFDEILRELDASGLKQIGKVSYSNFGYAVLGRVIETVTDSRWIDAARELVLEPQGVAHVTDDPPAPDRALRTDRNGSTRPPWNLAGSAYAAAGALWSPLDSLATYGWAIYQGGEFDNPRSGWHNVGQDWFHNGQTRDSGSCLVLCPELDCVIATHALSRVPFAADRLARRLRKALPAVVQTLN